MANLPEEYDRVSLEEELRDLQQKIDDLKTQVYFTPQSAEPVDVEVGTLAYSDGTNTDNTFGSSAEGFYYYASGTTWIPVGIDSNSTLTCEKVTISDNSSDNIQLSITNGTGASLRVLQTADQGGTVIDENGTASLTFKANDFFLQDTSDSTNRLSFNETALKLHDGNGNIVLQTATGGVDVTGRIKVTPQSAAPASASAGMLYYDSDDNKLKLHNGTSFVDLN